MFKKIKTHFSVAIKQVSLTLEKVSGHAVPSEFTRKAIFGPNILCF
jgi:hypothetical protein